MFTRVGTLAIEKSNELYNIARLILSAAIDLPSLLFRPCRPILKTILRQIYFTGIETLMVLFPISIAIGAVVTAQVINLIGVGSESLIAKILVFTVLRELGPLLTILIVIARSGAAIATELGTMQINHEVETLEAMGISPLHYLVLPRIIGVTLSVFILTIYFEFGTIAGGLLCGAIGWNIPFSQFSQGLYAALSIGEIIPGVIKSLSFGLFVSAICCSKGLQVEGSTTMVPQAATKGVMLSLFAVFLIDGTVTILLG